MKIGYSSLLLFLSLAGCTSHKAPSQQSTSLPEARRGFKTIVLPQTRQRDPVEQPPAAVFQTITYPAPVGELAAYLTPNPGDGRKHPAIIWITGGDCNTIGNVWSPASHENDQTASAYRDAGIVMMFPSLRGGNLNPGVKEGFFGEVDDVLAAAKYLESQSYVDPKRIYLGGHSTGGTLALLVAESSSRFRCVFSFGPIDDVSGYGADSGFLPFDLSNRKEVELRSPGYWLSSIQSPVWVFEGNSGGNIEPLRAMAKASTNPKTHFIEINGANHFATLAPTNKIIARKILEDAGETSAITFTEEEVNKSFAR
jgi:acetyl esterase/lipase